MSKFLLIQTFFLIFVKIIIMKINEITLYELYTNQKRNDFKLIEDNILRSDPEDGGSDHDVVIQDLSTGKYYAGSYCDWDIYYNFDYDEETGEVSRCDFDSDLIEVMPKEVMTTIYVPVK